ncbi:hypothetical protein [Nonomuraea sp. NPDC050405]
MSEKTSGISRRGFIAGTGTLLGVAALAGRGPARAAAQARTGANEHTA